MKDPAAINDVLLDLDGTVTDPQLGITRCIQFSLNRMGRETPPADQLLWCIGPPLKHSFASLLASDDEVLIGTALRHYRERFAETGLYENVVYPAIPEALRTIRSGGRRLFLATSKPVVFARRILDRFGLTRFFNGVYGSELDGRRVDKTELIDYLLHCEGLSRHTAMMVGDRRHDIIGGRNNGLATAAVTYGFGSNAEIAAAKPDFLFHHPAELAAAVSAQRPKAPDS
ncbi:MAG: HAD hydrolase-like protein [Desulfofustis sp.]|nr:HAD hydrolase-like protein [Desulfofustis sp.]